MKIRKPILNKDNLKERSLIYFPIIDLSESIVKGGDLNNKKIDEIKINESILT